MRIDSSGHRMRALGIGLCLSLLVLLGACSPAMPDTHSPFKALASRFDDGALGYGPDSYTPSVRSDHAMAYALILSAESIRYKRMGEPEALERARDAAAWLMENRDMDADGLIGWGLSFEWDAFQDGSTNPADWPYTITTTLAIQGLLDLHDVTADANLIGIALEATRTMLAHAFTQMEGAAWFHYSPSEFDDYDVYNVSAMMLGQLQRLVLHEPIWQEYADLVAAHLLARFIHERLLRVGFGVRASRFSAAYCRSAPEASRSGVVAPVSGSGAPFCVSNVALRLPGRLVTGSWGVDCG